MLEVLIVALVLAALHRQRLRRRRAALSFAEAEARVWARSQVVAILDAMLPAIHPYATKSTAHLYRHFDRRKTLDELEKDYPPGQSWLAQFRFDRV